MDARDANESSQSDLFPARRVAIPRGQRNAPARAQDANDPLALLALLPRRRYAIPGGQGNVPARAQDANESAQSDLFPAVRYAMPRDDSARSNSLYEDSSLDDESSFAAMMRELRGEPERGPVPLRLRSWPECLDGNCILSVEGAEIYVNKTYLSMHSPVFHRTFSGLASDRYEMHGVNKKKLVEMLCVIMPPRKPIDEKNVQSLLEMADAFEMDHLRKDCLSFLCSDAASIVFIPSGSEYEAAKSISCVVLTLLAFRYNSEELKERVKKCLFAQENTSFLRLSDSAHFDSLPSEARLWLFSLCSSRCHHFQPCSTVGCTTCPAFWSQPLPQYVPVPVLPILGPVVPTVAPAVPNLAFWYHR